MNKFDIVYDGQRLNWSGHGSYKATSGMPGHQSARAQCSPDKGPVPEGTYTLLLEEDKTSSVGEWGPKGLAKMAEEGCRLLPSHKI